MSAIVVLENKERWPLELPGVEVVSARSYLTDPAFSRPRGTTVFNLCRTYGYQTVGYYVSLLAVARGHRPLPSITTLQDLKLPPVVRGVSEDIEALIQSALRTLRADDFELSIYFGRNLARRYDRLSLALFNQFPAPFLRAFFVRDGHWRLERVRPIATNEIPEAHRSFVIERATEYLARPRRRARAKTYRYELAILRNPEEAEPPSNNRAIRRFIKAAHELGLDTTVIHPDDYGRIAEFDALFIRETTRVDHHTFRFARRATAEGLVVIDDPESIVRCCNKVFLAEAFARHGIARPRTLVVDSDDAKTASSVVGLPCVLKQPDSSFSHGVYKAETELELREALAKVLEDSELAIVQEFVHSEFDWRIGVLNGQPLYACKYHMARNHWQIIHRDANGQKSYGKVENVALEEVPLPALDLALRACKVVGDGLYGVDLKQIGNRFIVIEVNDNPSIDGGFEDALTGADLYRRIMRVFVERLDARRGIPKTA
jgi:glutathione synthase/RimK-type ligase-like ATP-grasp enzyme